ncbi:5'-nucleotidase C-terminal domain-containing protein [Vaginisenegalia massiliensis]|uniref:5'-nucleotidase C-terminal domain-containing protein n=1 Tax=Vaginisenegalia massiliensis TaxID=2058294 RepID=UPI000F52DD9A|nr:5'-nucleotidase C-terminal domain-containing protein [Vaginisenegalia massiliensis]
MSYQKRFVGSCSFALLSMLLVAQNPTALAAETTTQIAQPVAGETTTEVVTATNAPAPQVTTSQSQAVQPLAAAPVETTTTTVAKDVVILHTNDMHGRMEEEKNKAGDTSVIGLAKLDTIVETEKAKAGQVTYLLDAGDAFQGLPISNASKGMEMAKLMNQIGYDAMAVGNHEFDFGLDQIKAYKESLIFPLLSSNTYINGVRLFEASTILDKDPNQVGDELVVIGVTTPETATKTHPNNIVGVSFKDPLTEIKNVIKEIQAKATAEGKDYQNYVILGHLGIDPTTPAAWQGSTIAQALMNDPMLAGKKLIFIDGHSHSVETKVLSPNAVYNQTGTALNNIGKITLTAPGAIEAGLISAASTKDVVPNQATADQVAAVKDAFKAATSGVIVDNNPVELNGERSNVRVRQTNLGDLIADALYSYGQTGFSKPTDLAVTNGGGIRASIAKDKPITEYDVISVLPFGNIAAQIAVTGAQIQEMFNHALSASIQKDDAGNPILDDNTGLPLLGANGAFLQISGGRVFFDPRVEGTDRILRIEILDNVNGGYVALDPNKVYQLATNDFLAMGGDGYTMLGGKREEGPSLDSIFTNFLKDGVKLADYATINANNRLVALDPKADLDGDGLANADEWLVGRDLFVADKPEETKPEETKPEETKPEESKKEEAKKPTKTKATKADKKAAKAKEAKKLPSTGEEDLTLIFSGAALSILAGLGMVSLDRKKVNE